MRIGSPLASVLVAVIVLMAAYAVPARAGETPAELNQRGSELIKKSNYSEAKSAFEQALALAGRTRDSVQEAYAFLGLGRVCYYKGEYAQARHHAEDALQRFESLRDIAGLTKAYVLRAATRNLQGEQQQALADYEKALAYCDQVGDKTVKANILYNMSFVSALPVERQAAVLQQSAEIAHEIGDESLEAQVLHAWADELTTQSRFAEADEKLEAAAKLMQKTGDRERLARLFTSKGRLLRLQGQPARAIEWYRNALAIQQEIGDRTGVIQSYNAMGVAYSFIPDYVKAGECYQRGLDLALQSGSQRIIDFMTGAVASNYVARNDYARAVELLEQVIARGKDVWLDARYAELAEAYSGLGRNEEALAAIDKSIAIRRQKTHTMDLHKLLASRARILTGLGRDNEAIADARESIRLIEEERAKVVPTDSLKRSYAEAMQLYYAATVALLVKKGRADEALEISEKARARAFLDLLATREVAVRGPRYAGSELPSSAAAGALSARELAATAKRLRSTVLSYWVNPDAIYIWVVGSDGSIHLSTSPVSRERLIKIVAEASGDTAVLATRGEGSTAGQEQRPAIEIETRGGMTLQFGSDVTAPWRELYTLLIRPVAAWLPASNSRLTIIPHGPLFRVSFAALLDDSGHYLLEKYELHYASAGGVLQFTHRHARPRGERQPRYLLIADPSPMPGGNDRGALGRLPGARAEVEATARLLPAHAATLLEGSGATEAHVRRELDGSRVIHFATHGIVRDDSPLDSFLALSPGASESRGDDGRLTAEDIYRLYLHADLVFLSTCRSARGEVTGDGVAGLTRSFVYAGAPSVVASLWDVADEPTRRLVVDFYRAYVGKARPARALRLAQLHMLEQLRGPGVVISTPAGPLTLHDYPALWAGFVAIGEP